jgi:hypothetical protein
MVSSGLKLETTDDQRLIKTICTHEKVWPMTCDDYTPSAEAWKPPVGNGITWLLASDEEGILGLFCLIAENSVCWQVHVMMLPYAWGPPTVKATLDMYEWVWKNTTCVRLTGSIPIDNPLTIGLAIRSGMVEFGVNPKSFKRKGKLLDQVLFGISRPGAV